MNLPWHFNLTCIIALIGNENEPGNLEETEVEVTTTLGDTNSDPTQGKPRCMTYAFKVLFYFTYVYVMYCALKLGFDRNPSCIINSMSPMVFRSRM